MTSWQKSSVTATAFALLLAILFPSPSFAASFATWTQVGTTGSWKSVTCSTNCETSYAAISSGLISKSIDGGATWSSLANSGSRAWTAVATSGDGSIVYATVSNGGIYKSVDGGSNWSVLTNASTRAWLSLATNLDGSIIAAGVTSGSIWSSIDGGASWVEQTSIGVTRTWTSLDLTDDGTTIVASGGSGGGIWRGTGTAGSWTWSNITTGKSATDSTSLTSQNWYSVVTDSTGTKIGATAGDLYFSNDSGATWKHVTSGNYYWISLSGSADLKTMIMVSGDGANNTCVPRLITTTDYSTFTASQVGTIWVPYSSVAVAKDASRAIASTASSYIYKAGDVYTPNMSTTTTLSIAGNVTSVEKRRSVNITATVSSPGRVTFYSNGKKIGNCIAVVATSTATCPFKASIVGALAIKATLRPSTAGYLSSTSTNLLIAAVNRTNLR